LIGAAILLGGAALLAMDRLLPHEHFIKGREGADAKQLRRTWLFVIAITLHNLPEGLAIGVGYAANEGCVPARSRWALPYRMYPRVLSSQPLCWLPAIPEALR
jgi:hypothetical protein